jgi:uncharacterized protein
MKTVDVEFYNTNNQKLIGEIYIPESESKTVCPCVLNLHGLGGKGMTSQSYISVGKQLAKLGFIYLNFNLSGIFPSEGKFEESTFSKYIDDLESAIKFMKSLDYIDGDSISLIGTSMGGAVALNEALKNPKIKSLVMVAGVSSIEKWYNKHFNLELIEEIKKTGFWNRQLNVGLEKKCLNYEFMKDWITYSFKDKLQNIKCPVLIIQGDQDMSIPIEWSQDLYDNLQTKKEIQIISGADHKFHGLIDKKEKFIIKHFIELLNISK